MGRIIGIDYGSKRTGIAVSDVLGISVNPLGTFMPVEAITFLRNYIAANAVDTIVVGYPRRLNGMASAAAAGAEQFAKRLRREFPSITIQLYDERYTTKMAKQAMLDGGAVRSRRTDKALLDQLSACILLQSYIDYCINMAQRASNDQHDG
jgi:putative Holliday junction resolvase